VLYMCILLMCILLFAFSDLSFVALSFSTGIVRGTGVGCFSFFFCLRVLDKPEYLAFESTLNSPIVSCRTLILFVRSFDL